MYISVCKFKLRVVIQNYIMGNFNSLYVISDFCRKVYELHALLGYYTAYGDNYLQTFGTDRLTHCMLRNIIKEHSSQQLLVSH